MTFAAPRLHLYTLVADVVGRYRVATSFEALDDDEARKAATGRMAHWRSEHGRAFRGATLSRAAGDCRVVPLESRS